MQQLVQRPLLFRSTIPYPCVKTALGKRLRSFGKNRMTSGFAILWYREKKRGAKHSLRLLS
jgi:hypothetical protein